MSKLKKIEELKNGKNIKEYSDNELIELCGEIREFLIDSISETGGHLASNLGAVEATVCLHKVFNFPSDKLIFDVGHQSYVHKILTGRIDEFKNLRKYKGLSGFPKNNESEYDVFNSGHSSNSISVALGLKRALEYKGDKKSKVIAFIGDGALTGGMAFEALNDAGRSKSNIIIILNDNEMSISENVGGIAKHLSKIRTSKRYLKIKTRSAKFIEAIPGIGKMLYKLISALKKPFRNIASNHQNNIFESLGFYYAGPFDGHNTEELTDAFSSISTIEKPAVVHIITKKGKGYKFAEEQPDMYHGVKKFDKEKKLERKDNNDFSSVFGSELVKLAHNNKNIAAITAAMPDGTGLNSFKNTFSDRYYDVAIAEGHAVGLSAGLAIGGMIPVFAVYSAFLLRGYDQLITDVCGMNLHCVFCVDRSGLVGEDGETHHGIFDNAYLSLIPNLTVMSPATFDDFRFMLKSAIEDYNSPCVIKYPKGKESEIVLKYSDKSVGNKKAQILKNGTDVTVICDGAMCESGLIAAEILEKNNISAEVINLRYIKPVDKETVTASIAKTKKCAVIENGVSNGGIYSMITTLTNEKVIGINTGDKFVSQGSVDELFCELSMDGKSIADEILKEFFN